MKRCRLLATRHLGVPHEQEHVFDDIFRGVVKMDVKNITSRRWDFDRFEAQHTFMDRMESIFLVEKDQDGFLICGGRDNDLHWLFSILYARLQAILAWISISQHLGFVVGDILAKLLLRNIFLIILRRKFKLIKNRVSAMLEDNQLCNCS